MEFLCGLLGKDYVLVCADTQATHSIVRLKDTEDKIPQVQDNCVFATSGEPGDRTEFTAYLEAHIKLYSVRYGFKLDTEGIANMVRSELAATIRKTPKMANMLIAGYDEHKGPSLYWMDYLATLVPSKITAHGYGGYFALSFLDEKWKPDQTQEQAVELMKDAINIVKKRFSYAPNKYQFRLINKDGVHDPLQSSQGYYSP